MLSQEENKRETFLKVLFHEYFFLSVFTHCLLKNLESLNEMDFPWMLLKTILLNKYLINGLTGSPLSTLSPPVNSSPCPNSKCSTGLCLSDLCLNRLSVLAFSPSLYLLAFARLWEALPHPRVFLSLSLSHAVSMTPVPLPETSLNTVSSHKLFLSLVTISSPLIIPVHSTLHFSFIESQFSYVIFPKAWITCFMSISHASSGQGLCGPVLCCLPVPSTCLVLGKHSSISSINEVHSYLEKDCHGITRSLRITH